VTPLPIRSQKACHHEAGLPGQHRENNLDRGHGKMPGLPVQQIPAVSRCAETSKALALQGCNGAGKVCGTACGN
jgi:hypothetical protein